MATLDADDLAAIEALDPMNYQGDSIQVTRR